MSDVIKQYRARFATRMNHAPGSITPHPGGYPLVLVGQWHATRTEAMDELVGGRLAMESWHGWTFDVEEVAPTPGAPP
jgi:hypothetical protein